MSDTTTLLPASALRSQAHTDCVLACQDEDIAKGVIKAASLHPDPKANLGYRAVVFNSDGTLAEVRNIRETKRVRASCQAIPKNGFIWSFHFGGVFGQGVSVITECREKGAGAQAGQLELVSRPATAKDVTEGCIREAKSKNAWTSGFLCESYDDALLPPHQGMAKVHRRPLADVLLRFAAERGIELDEAVVNTTDRADVHPVQMCDDEHMANMMRFPKIWDSVMKRGYSSEFYGLYRGVVGQADKLSVEGMSEEEALGYVAAAKQNYDQILRVTTVYHSNSRGRYPHFYMFMTYDHAGPARRTTSTFTALLDRYVSGELRVEDDIEEEHESAVGLQNPFDTIELKEAA